MKTRFRTSALICLPLLLLTTAVLAQSDETVAEPSAGAETADAAVKTVDAPASQEVGVNEDNYRQFMELKDVRQQRNILPENAYQSQAGMQKLDKLPEASQKHLRNQLREIIIQGDAWQPGDEQTVYPYVPSEAAGSDAGLQEKEVEAWGELVDNYHAREADIYANAMRSQAAQASTGDTAGDQGGAEGPAGEQAGQNGGGQNAGQESSTAQNRSAGSYSPNSPDDPNTSQTTGVSQNAMEFLKEHGSADACTVQDNPDSTAGVPQNAMESLTEPGSADAGTVQDNPDSTAGVSQNAMEFLKDQGSADAGTMQDTPDSTTGVSQNALEYLNREDHQNGHPAPSDATESAGTLSIEDLVNARGVGAETTTGTDGETSDANNSDPDG